MMKKKVTHKKTKKSPSAKQEHLSKDTVALGLQSEIIKNMAEGVYLVRAQDGIIVYANPKFEKMFGYRLGEMVGKHVSIVNAPTALKPEETAKKIMAILKETGTWQGEVNNIKKDGTLFWCSAKVSVFNHPDYGDILVAVHENITERKKAEEELRVVAEKEKQTNERLRRIMNELQEKDQRLLNHAEALEKTKKNLEAALNEVEMQRHVVLEDRNRLDTIIQQMGEGVMVIDEHDGIELMNLKARDMLGYSEEQEIPAGYKKFFILQLWKELHGPRNDRSVCLKELKLQRPKEAILSISLVRLTHAEQDTGFVAVMRDVTQERKIEQMKSDFVANVSHEIRSPMAPMKDALSLVVDGTAGPLTENQLRFLTLVANNMDRLARLINDLLDLSKIEAGKFEIRKEANDLNLLVREVTESIKTFAEKKRITLSVLLGEDIPVVMIDKDRITQVIINLVTNAIKFMPEFGTVTVACHISKRSTKQEARSTKNEAERSTDHHASCIVPHASFDGNFVEFSVKDTGPGMLPEEVDALFNRFKQLVSPERVKGTGLGLAISKAIVEMHGGRIWVESEKGKGSVFKVALPVGE